MCRSGEIAIELEYAADDAGQVLPDNRGGGILKIKTRLIVLELFLLTCRYFENLEKTVSFPNV